MTTSRRDFLAGTAGLGVTGLLTNPLPAAEPREGGEKKKPSMSMVVETVFTDGIAQMSYLVGDKATGRAAVIDPTRDVERYVELAKKHKLTVTHALETHVHADFVSGTRELCDRTGTAKPYLSA